MQNRRTFLGYTAAAMAAAPVGSALAQAVQATGSVTQSGLVGKLEGVDAAAALATQGVDVAVASVNSDAQDKGSDCLTYKGVTGFPTVLLEKAGASAHDLAYNGARNATALVAWVKASL